MTVTERNKQGNATEAVLTQDEMAVIFWAVYYSAKPDMESSRKSLDLLEGLCGMEAVTIRFDGRGKNGL